MTKTFQISGFRKACPDLVAGGELEIILIYAFPFSKKNVAFNLIFELSSTNYKMKVILQITHIKFFLTT